MLMVRSAAAISCSLREEGVVDTIVGAERKKKPWWSPLFDIVDKAKPPSFTASSPLSSMSANAEGETSTVANPNTKAARRRGLGFTAEKARLLRKELRATESFHDVMYHSAIASHLAFMDNHSSSFAG